MWIFSLLFGGNVLGHTLQEDIFKVKQITFLNLKNVWKSDMRWEPENFENLKTFSSILVASGQSLQVELLFDWISTKKFHMWNVRIF